MLYPGLLQGITCELKIRYQRQSATIPRIRASQLAENNADFKQSNNTLISQPNDGFYNPDLDSDSIEQPMDDIIPIFFEPSNLQSNQALNDKRISK